MTLVLVQMTYSISSEYGFWKVKLLVRISSHSRLFVRNRYMTDSTWPFSFTTCRHIPRRTWAGGGMDGKRNPRGASGSQHGRYGKDGNGAEGTGEREPPATEALRPRPHPHTALYLAHYAPST